ncbi:MAG: hypothetical protein OHK0044_31950 [Burkholderiaceae bacterium]
MALRRKTQAIRYAEASRGLNDNPIATARACQEILFSSGLADEAYARYAIAANQGTTFLATFRAMAKKCPTQLPAKILDDLVASTPGQEGKWFAAAKDGGLYDEAIALAQRTPCDPRTLTRAARDFAATKPWFAVEAVLAALRWIAAGYGYEITGVDVLAACSSTLAAARNGGSIDEIEGRIRALIVGPRSTAKDSLPRRLEHEQSRDLDARTCEGCSATRDRRSHPPHGQSAARPPAQAELFHQSGRPMADRSHDALMERLPSLWSPHTRASSFALPAIMTDC